MSNTKKEELEVQENSKKEEQSERKSESKFENQSLVLNFQFMVYEKNENNISPERSVNNIKEALNRKIRLFRDINNENENKNKNKNESENKNKSNQKMKKNKKEKKREKLRSEEEDLNFEISINTYYSTNQIHLIRNLILRLEQENWWVTLDPKDNPTYRLGYKKDDQKKSVVRKFMVIKLFN